MGLFDKKEVREEKRIYKELTAIKDYINELKFLLPKQKRNFYLQYIKNV